MWLTFMVIGGIFFWLLFVDIDTKRAMEMEPIEEKGWLKHIGEALIGLVLMVFTFIGLWFITI